MIEQHGLSGVFSPTKLKLSGMKTRVDQAHTSILHYLLRNAPREGVVVFPAEWEPQGNSNLHIVNLDPRSQEFTLLQTRFNQTLSSKAIVKIERIQNKWLWEKYFFQKILLEKKNGHKNNELLLFHGTRSNPPQVLYNGQDGFDYKFSDGGMWGRGTYFATNAVYSDSYSFQVPSTSEQQFFMAKALIGDTVELPSDGQLKMPPVKPSQSKAHHEERFDSVKAITSSSINYVVYDISRAYPAYLVTYK